MEQWLDRYTPDRLKHICDRLLTKLPNRMEKWIRQNKAKSIVIFFTIRGLFFRPSMWVLYASLFAYFRK